MGDSVRDVLYLVPEGFELRKNAERRPEVARKPQDIVPAEEEIKYPEGEIDPADIP